MRVGIFRFADRPKSHEAMDWWEAGVRCCGDKPVRLDVGDSSKALAGIDVGISLFIPDKRRRGKHRVFISKAARALRQQGKRVLYFSVGFVHSRCDYEEENGIPLGAAFEYIAELSDGEREAALSRIHYEAGFDGLKGEADYCNRGAPEDRWNRLGVSLTPWRRSDGYILLIGQQPGGPSTQDVDIVQWYRDTVASIRQVTGRTIVFRQHPRTALRDDAEDREADLPSSLVLSRNVYLRDDLRGAAAVVAFSSNAAVTAAIAGIPVFVASKRCMAWPVGNRDLRRIEDPEFPDRSRWAAELAYTQWSVKEITTGAAWAWLRPHALRGPRSCM